MINKYKKLMVLLVLLLGSNIIKTNAQANYWALNGSWWNAKTETYATQAQLNAMASTDIEPSLISIPAKCQVSLRLNSQLGTQIPYPHLTSWYLSEVSDNPLYYPVPDSLLEFNFSGLIYPSKLNTDGTRYLYGISSGYPMVIKRYLLNNKGQKVKDTILYTSPANQLETVLYLNTYPIHNPIKVSADGKYIIMCGSASNWGGNNILFEFNLATNTMYKVILPKGSKITGFEYVTNFSPTPRVYVSYYTIDSVTNNNIIDGRLGYFPLNSTAFTAVPVPAPLYYGGFLYTDIVASPSGKIYLAYNPDYQANGLQPSYLPHSGLLYSLNAAGVFTNLNISVPPPNTTVPQKEYSWITQIEGEDYTQTAIAHHLPAFTKDSVMLNKKKGYTATLYTDTNNVVYCPIDSLKLTLKTNIYTDSILVKIRKGTITNANTWVDSSNSSNYIYSKKLYAANASVLLYNLDTSFKNYNGSLKVSVTTYNGCKDSTLPIIVYYKILPFSYQKEFSMLAASTCPLLPGHTVREKPRVTTLPLLTPMPIIPTTSPADRALLCPALEWQGISSAGMVNIQIAIGTKYRISVFEVDSITGLRKKISGIYAPNVIDYKDSNSFTGSFAFNTYARAFDPTLPPFYIDTNSTSSYFYDYYNWICATYGITSTSSNLAGLAALTAFSGKVWRAELSILSKDGCVDTNYSYFRLVNNNRTTGHSLKISHSITSNDEDPILYPNPANSSITIGNIQSFATNATMLLYDNVGRIVYKNTTVQKQNGFLDISALAKGLYLYRFTNGSTTYNGKIIKE